MHCRRVGTNTQGEAGEHQTHRFGVLISSVRALKKSWTPAQILNSGLGVQATKSLVGVNKPCCHWLPKTTDR